MDRVDGRCGVEFVYDDDGAQRRWTDCSLPKGHTGRHLNDDARHAADAVRGERRERDVGIGGRMEEDANGRWRGDRGGFFALPAQEEPSEDERERVARAIATFHRGHYSGSPLIAPSDSDFRLADRILSILRPPRAVESETEVERLREALEKLFPVAEGFTEAFDDLERMGLIVEVPADEAFRDEWDADTMYVWAWRLRSQRKEEQG